MPYTKNEVLTIYITAEVKALFKLAASAASVVEVLDYTKARGLGVADSKQSTSQGAITGPR